MQLRFVLVLLFLLTLTPVSTYAGQTVTVRMEAGQGSALSVKERARDAAFVQACMQEATSILRHDLEPDRRDLLEDFLRPKAGQFVLSYSDRSFEKQGSEYVLRTMVNINAAELKRQLKSLGVYYTAETKWPYTLKTSGFGVEDLEHVLNLQLLTGLEPQADAPLKLQLEKMGDDYWRSVLIDDTSQWQGEGRNLEDAWYKVWGQFFSRAEVQSLMAQSFVLRIKGWTTTEGVAAFSALLHDWDGVVDLATIVTLEYKPDGLVGVWAVRTVDVGGLETRLTSYTRDRGLTYSLHTGEDAAGLSNARVTTEGLTY